MPGVVSSWLINLVQSILAWLDLASSLGSRITSDGTDEDGSIGKLKYGFKTWTSTVVFTCLILSSERQLDNPRPLLDTMLKNDTLLWKQWKTMVAGKLGKPKSVPEGQMFSEGELNKGKTELAKLKIDEGWVGDGDGERLEIYICDAEDAWHMWCKHLGGAEWVIALGGEEKAAK